MASGAWKSYADTVRARTQSFFSKADAPKEAHVPSTARVPADATLVAPISESDDPHPPFPVIPEAKLQRLFPSAGHDGSSQYSCVRSALREMELAYRMDPCLVGEKSGTVRGYWALAELVRRVAVEPDTAPPKIEQGDIPLALSATQQRAPSATQRARRPYEPHDVYAAVERKDIDTIMAIRDKDFALLLGGDEARTPLEYAISLGPEYDRVSLFLAGALSRFVNQLPDQVADAGEATLSTLRKVRANLKLAIDHSLDREQTALLASYIQILVMAEGVRWIAQSTKAVAHELRAAASSDAYAPRPTHVARDIVSQFLTANLRMRRKRDQYVVAAIEDYIANAASDLVLLALWERVRGSDAPLPDYAFARDDRIATAYCEAIAGARHGGARQPQRVWTLAQRAADALDEGLRRRTAHERLEILARIVDSSIS